MFYKLYYTYILASDSGTFYIGFTGFLEQRVFQHKEKRSKASPRNMASTACFTLNPSMTLTLVSLARLS